MTAVAWENAVEQAITANQGRPGSLLPILHDIQHALGHVPADSIPRIADALNLSRAEVHGVVSFYHDFRETPRGRHLVHVCRAEACQSLGAEALVAHACSRLGIALHETTSDGRFSLEPIYCLGNCALSPAIMIDGELHGRVSPARFDEIVADLEGDA